MDSPKEQPPPSPDQARQSEQVLLKQLNVVELAARRGIGPMSLQAEDVWHGHAWPCVSCGHLVLRAETTCSECGQDISPEMIKKMEAHSGPWYVHEHVRPFPGVSLERLIRQAHRGVLVETTVVRGPTTHHQWRFACETPILSKYLGYCWCCHAAVSETDNTCLDCGIDLDGGFNESAVLNGQPAQPQVQMIPADGSNELHQLSAAISTVPKSLRRREETETSKASLLPIPWLVGILSVVAVAAVLVVVWLRADAAIATKPASAPTDATAPVEATPARAIPDDAPPLSEMNKQSLKNPASHNFHDRRTK